jgi:sigma-B regulation protein RsbQ
MQSEIRQRNNVRSIGDGQAPILFVHGFGCDQNMWRFVTPAFEQDYRLVLFDYVGSGRSDVTCYNPERYANLNGYAQDILDVCNALELRDVILVGHSVSGVTGILAALKQPELFRALILISPSPRYIDDPPNYRGGLKRSDVDELLATMEKNYIGWANFLAPVIIQRPDRPELAAELSESFCSTDPQIARRFAEATFYSDNRADLSKVTHPSLIIQCAEDAIAPVEVGQFMHEQMPASALRILDTTGHCPHMSAPEQTIDAMKSFLGSELATVEGRRGRVSRAV